MGELAVFMEESCFDEKGFRQTRAEVVFRLYSTGKIQGQRLDFEFRADYGVYFDPEDTYLISFLKEAKPEIDWDKFIFHRRVDRFGIDIWDIDKNKRVGGIIVRRRVGGDPAGETETTNVLSIADYLAARKDAFNDVPD